MNSKQMVSIYYYYELGQH